MHSKWLTVKHTETEAALQGLSISTFHYFSNSSDETSILYIPSIKYTALPQWLAPSTLPM